MHGLAAPWPWWISGPLIGLTVPLLLWVGGRYLGVSANFRHLCAAWLPRKPAFFHYDWRREGLWNLVFGVGMVLGGAIGFRLLSDPAAAPRLSAATGSALAASGLALAPVAPPELLSWEALGTPRGLVTMVLGGFLVGFGARWAGGCTSGHAIFGLATGRLSSLVAVLGFFAGGIVAVWAILPWILG